MSLVRKIEAVFGRPEFTLVRQFGVPGLNVAQRAATYIIDGESTFSPFAAQVLECLEQLPVCYFDVFFSGGVADQDVVFADGPDVVQYLAHFVLAVPSGEVFLFNLK